MKPHLKRSASCSSSSLASLLALCVFLLCSVSVNANELNSQADSVPRHSYISCAIISSEHLTALQLYQRGVSEQTALSSLPNLSRAARKRVSYLYQLANNIGVLNAYADINTNFTRCAAGVHKRIGVPAKDSSEYGYYFCAGENRIRFETLLYTDRYQNLEKVLEKTPDTHFDVAIDYFKLIQSKGLLAAFDLTANNLKACLNTL